MGVVLNTWTVKDNKRVPITIDPQDKPDRTIPISKILDFTKISTSAGIPVIEPVVEPAVEPVVEPVVEPIKRKDKITITFSEADKKKMEGMTRNQRMNYAIGLGKKHKEINTNAAVDLFDMTKHFNMFNRFFSRIVKGPFTAQNRYFKISLLNAWSIDNKKHINNLDKIYLVGELDKALEVRGIDVNEMFMIGKKYYEENPHHLIVI